MAAVVLTGQVTAEEIAAIGHGAAIELDSGALERVRANREVLEDLIRADTQIYGITTGFGALASSRVAPELHRGLQLNLLRSHAAGTGEELPREVVRAAVAVRLNSLLRGHSGIRPLVLERAALLINGG